jgi:hypothetical protein
MKKDPWKILRGVILAITVGGVLPGALNEEQLECEQAIAHLEECCPALNAPLVCGDGCSSVTLTLDTSHCLQDSSCAEVQAAGMCKRVMDLSNTAADAGITGEEAVCP